jgi:hypothetical protein
MSAPLSLSLSTSLSSPAPCHSHPQAKFRTKLTLLPDEPRHLLVLDSSVPLDFVTLYCNVYADVEPSPGCKAVLAVNGEKFLPPPSADAHGKPGSTPSLPSAAAPFTSGGATPASSSGSLSMTFRCPPNVNRIEAKFRFMEGRAGTLRLYVVPVAPVSTAATVNLEIRPLCLHRRQQISTGTSPAGPTESPKKGAAAGAAAEKPGGQQNVMV